MSMDVPNPFDSNPEFRRMVEKLNSQMKPWLDAQESLRRQLDQQTQLQDAVRRALEPLEGSMRKWQDTVRDLLEPTNVRWADLMASIAASSTFEAAVEPALAAADISEPTSDPSALGPGLAMSWVAMYGGIFAFVDLQVGDDVRNVAGEHAIAILAMLTLYLIDAIRRS